MSSQEQRDDVQLLVRYARTCRVLLWSGRCALVHAWRLAPAVPVRVYILFGLLCRVQAPRALQ
jgi:hypothetical protein